MRLCPMIMMMKDNAGQMPGPGVTVIIVIPLRLRVSVDNRWITVVRSVRSDFATASMYVLCIYI